MRARRRIRVHGGGDANGEKEQVVVGQLPEDFRVNTLSTADSLRHHCKPGGGSASIPSPAPVSTGGRSRVGRSSDGHNEHSRIVLPPETGEQPSLVRLE